MNIQPTIFYPYLIMIIIIILVVSAVFYIMHISSCTQRARAGPYISRIMFLLQGFPKGFLWDGADQPGGAGMHEIGQVYIMKYIPLFIDSAHISVHSSPALLQALNSYWFLEIIFIRVS